MSTPTPVTAVDQSLLYPSPYKEFWQAFSKNKGAVAGLMFMCVIVFCAIFAPWVAPHNPSEQYRDFLLTPPVWLEGGQWQFLLGTDELGRDLLSRLIEGSRLSLLIGLSSVVISLIPGVILGLFAGFFPRILGPGIMRLMDIMLALPSLLLAVAIVAITAANDQYTLDGAVRQNRHMGQHLVIDELVGFGGLNNTIQRHDTAHHRVFENNQMLVFCSHFMEQLVHAKTLAVAFVKGFKIIGFKRFGHGKSP